jgi:hypothetical protein
MERYKSKVDRFGDLSKIWAPPVSPNEDPADYLALLREILQAYAPADVLEHMQAVEIAQDTWIISRARRRALEIETALDKEGDALDKELHWDDYGRGTFQLAPRQTYTEYAKRHRHADESVTRATTRRNANMRDLERRQAARAKRVQDVIDRAEAAE